MNNLIADYNQTLTELTERYKAAGYEVIIQPMQDELPDFLRYFHPDVIARRNDQSVVAEIRAPGKIRRKDYWHELSDVLKQHPGWQLEVVGSSQTQEQNDTISQEEIQQQILRSQTLAASGNLDAALLIGWAALEAAMRLVAERYNLTVSDGRAESLFVKLTGEGLMDRENHDFLRTFIAQRNAVAHGFRQEIQGSDLDRLHLVTETLLSE